MTFKFKTKTKNKGHHRCADEMGHRRIIHTEQNQLNTQEYVSMHVTQHLPELQGEMDIPTIITGDFNFKNNNLIAQADKNLAEISKS